MQSKNLEHVCRQLPAGLALCLTFPLALALAVLMRAPGVASNPSASINSLPPMLAARLDGVARRALVLEHIPGLSIGIVRRGRLVYARGFGNRYIASSTPADALTRYQIASNSKQFTAAAVLLLRDQGKLQLDEPISTWFPGFPHAAEITVRQLLSHTAGLRDFFSSPLFTQEVLQPGSAQKIIEIASTLPLVYPPGTRYEYSNTDYVLAGRIVEIVSGQSLAEFVTSHILRPLGMTETGYLPTDDATTVDLAIGYSSFALGTYHRVSMTDLGWAFGCGDVTSTVYDLAKWNAAIDGGTLLSRDSTLLMHTAVTLPDGSSTGYGLGLEIERLPSGHREWRHGGATPGFITDDARFPDDALDVIVLTNSDQTVVRPIVLSLYDAMTGASAAMAPPTHAGVDVASASTVPEPGRDDAKMEGWFRSAITGNVDRTLIAPDYAAQLTPEQLADLAALRRYGPLRSFTFYNAIHREPRTSLFYHARFPARTLTFLVEVDDRGVIHNVVVANGDAI